MAFVIYEPAFAIESCCICFKQIGERGTALAKPMLWCNAPTNPEVKKWTVLREAREKQIPSSAGDGKPLTNFVCFPLIKGQKPRNHMVHC